MRNLKHLTTFPIFYTGNCYAKVREETKAIQEAMNEKDRLYKAPRQEITYVYKVRVNTNGPRLQRLKVESARLNRPKNSDVVTKRDN